MNLTELSNELDAQVVTRIEGRDVTRAELSRAFSRVEPKQNWKNPIDAIVVISSSYERLAIAAAVTFFTGSVATFDVVRLEANHSTYRVRAAGYYAAIGA
jgi:high-affinity K+ transport system ATPase subunit B